MATAEVLIGYAIGSAQILLIDWVRNRLGHGRHLRVLRAELRRAAGFNKKFGWTQPGGPKDDSFPRPPSVSPKYADIVTGTDFYLTDEHDDDNTQQALLEVLDGCNGLAYYSDRVHSTYDQMKAEQEASKRAKLKSEALSFADAYDLELEKLLFVIRSALLDLDRRIRESGMRRQLLRRMRRPTGKLPPGENPPPLLPAGDPRLRGS